MRTIETKVYTFDELAERAKENARNWYREGGLDYEWWDFIYEDAERIGLKLESFDLDRRLHATGRLTVSGRDCARAIIEDHGKECDTYKVAISHIFSREAFDEEEFLKDLLHSYAWLLQREYEYLLSDESVDESIQANEYEFTENGRPV